MALEILLRYREGGNSVLGSYRDQPRPFDVDAHLQSLLERPETLPVHLPELNRYLLDYPNATLANVESSFYRERVNFDLKPTLRLNHMIAYRLADPRSAAHVVAEKQLHASRYFQLALDLTACVPEVGRANNAGFYLISLKGSIQQGLARLKGSLLRRIVVSKRRTAQEKALINIKKVLEEDR